MDLVLNEFTDMVKAFSLNLLMESPFLDLQLHLSDILGLLESLKQRLVE